MRAVPLACLILLVAGCDGRPPEYELSGGIMGTSYSIKIVAAQRPDLDDLQATIVSALDAVDQRMSTYKTDSELSRFNASDSTEWVPVSTALCETVAAAIAIGDMTGGAFDVTVGPAVNLWGFGPDDAPDAVPQDSEIDAALARVGYRKLQADCEQPAIRKSAADVYVDLSGIAKGLAVDTVANLLESKSTTNYLVEIGGELRARGVNAAGEPWTIAIEEPDFAARSVHALARLTGKAMATSGDYRNFYERAGTRYSHTIDPRTARPVTHNGASVTVIDHSATTADALATALLVMGPEKGFDFAKSHGIAAYFIARGEGATVSRATPSFAEYLP